MPSEFKVIESPWIGRFINLIRSCKYNLRIIVPYLSREIVDLIIWNLTNRNINIKFLTRLTPEDVNTGIADPELLGYLISLKNVKVRVCRNIHAKVIIVDDKQAVITSSNLTHGGLEDNIEVGILLKGSKVRSIIKLFEKYWNDERIIDLRKNPDVIKKFKKLSSKKASNIRRYKVDQIINRIKPKGIDEEYNYQLKRSKENQLLRELQWIREEFGKGLVESRLKFEEKARQLIQTRLGNLRRYDINLLLKWLDSDNRGQVRMGQAFKGKNLELILNNNINLLNKLIKELWLSDSVEVFDIFYKKIKGAGTTLPSNLYYLKSPERYNIWVPAAERGLRKIFDLKSLGRGSLSRKYFIFNILANKLKRTYKIMPQELDILLTRIGS